ncbi:hypothetical protein COOONC_20576 [Cooperia oncophora]
MSAFQEWGRQSVAARLASQYIGELCRYLLAQPVVPEEATHQMRLSMGTVFVRKYGNNLWTDSE